MHFFTSQFLLIFFIFEIHDARGDANCIVNFYDRETEIVCRGLQSTGVTLDQLFSRPLPTSSRNDATFNAAVNGSQVNTVSLHGNDFAVSEHALDAFVNLANLRLKGERKGTYPTLHPSAFKRLSKLKFLQVDTIVLNEQTLQSVKDTVEILRIYECPMERWPAVLGQFGKLRTVAIFKTNLSEIAADAFEKSAAHLNDIWLPYNKIQAVPRNAFRRLSRLTVLDFRCNNVSTIEAGAFDDLVKLLDVDFALNQLKSLPENLFSKNAEITDLNLFGNPMDEVPREKFANLTKLTTYVSPRQPGYTGRSCD